MNTQIWTIQRRERIREIIPKNNLKIGIRGLYLW